MRHCDDQYPWLSEFLCEYVDGTMAPSARAAFEECLRGNAALQQHVARLKATRAVLGDYGCDVHAPCNLRDSLHARLEREGLLAADAEADAAPVRTRPVWVWAPALLAFFCLAAAGLLVLPDEAPQTTPTVAIDPEPAGASTRGSVPMRAVVDRPAVPHADTVRRATQYRPYVGASPRVATPHFAATSIALP